MPEATRYDFWLKHSGVSTHSQEHVTQAAALAIKARDAGLTGIIGQHLSIPVTCHPRFFPVAQLIHGPLELLSWQQNRDAPLVDAVRMETFWDLYVGTEPGPDPLHSPLLCRDLRALPPTSECGNVMVLQALSCC